MCVCVVIKKLVMLEKQANCAKTMEVTKILIEILNTAGAFILFFNYCVIVCDYMPLNRLNRLNRLR